MDEQRLVGAAAVAEVLMDVYNRLVLRSRVKAGAQERHSGASQEVPAVHAAILSAFAPDDQGGVDAHKDLPYWRPRHGRRAVRAGIAAVMAAAGAASPGRICAVVPCR